MSSQRYKANNNIMTGMVRFFPVLLLAFSVIFLASCETKYEIIERVDRNAQKADMALMDINKKHDRVASPLIVDNEHWFGENAIPIRNGVALPGSLMGQKGVVLTFDRPLTMGELAKAIQTATGVRVVVVKSTAGKRAGGSDEAPKFMPTDGDEVLGGRVVWQGSLSALLDQAADNFDAEWTYNGEYVSLSEDVTRTFMLHALATETDQDDSLSSGGGEAGGNLPTIGVTSKAQIKIWKEVEDAVKTFLGRGGKAAFSPATGTVTVSGSPSSVARVEEYLKLQNSMRLRRVAVSVNVLSIVIEDENNYNFSLTSLLEDAIGQRPFRFNTSVSGLNTGILNTEVAGEAQGIITALTRDNRVSLAHSGAVVTLSDQSAPLQVGRQVSYLERISASTGDGGGSTSLEPGQVDLGLAMNILPRVIDRDRILLRLAVSITDAPEPFAEFASGGQTIQLPEVETTGFLQNAVLAAGETLVLSGFERRENSYEKEGLPGPFWTGGDEDFNTKREMSVLLITAEILPEDPVTVMR